MAQFKGKNSGKAWGQASKPTKAEVWRRINENCRFCIYDKHAEGTWREQIEACTSTDCALYPIRPVSENYEPAREDS